MLPRWPALCRCSCRSPSRFIDLLLDDAQLTLPHDRVDPGDVSSYGLEPTVTLQLAGRRLEPQVEQRLLGLAQLLDEIGVGLLSKRGGLELLRTSSHHCSPASQVTMRHVI